MTRRARSTQADIEKALRKVSLSHGADFRSGTSIRAFRSRGVCNRVSDLRSGRVQELFSDGEYWFQEYIAFDHRIVYADEQWPILPISDTVAVAAELGFDHPRLAPGVNKEVRTDMLLGIRHAPGARVTEVVLEVKDSPAHYEGEDRARARAREKRTIVDIWCKANGKKFLVLFKSDVPSVQRKNLGWLRYGQFRSKLTLGKLRLNQFAEEFRSQWRKRPAETLDSLALRTAATLGLNRDAALCAFQQCVWRRLILVDLRFPVLPCESLRATDDSHMGIVYPW